MQYEVFFLCVNNDLNLNGLPVWNGDGGGHGGDVRSCSCKTDRRAGRGPCTWSPSSPDSVLLRSEIRPNIVSYHCKSSLLSFSAIFMN